MKELSVFQLSDIPELIYALVIDPDKLLRQKKTKKAMTCLLSESQESIYRHVKAKIHDEFRRLKNIPRIVFQAKLILTVESVLACEKNEDYAKKGCRLLNLLLKHLAMNLGPVKNSGEEHEILEKLTRIHSIELYPILLKGFNWDKKQLLRLLEKVEKQSISAFDFIATTKNKKPTGKFAPSVSVESKLVQQTKEAISESLYSLFVATKKIKDAKITESALSVLESVLQKSKETQQENFLMFDLAEVAEALFENISECKHNQNTCLKTENFFMEMYAIVEKTLAKELCMDPKILAEDFFDRFIRKLKYNPKDMDFWLQQIF